MDGYLPGVVRVICYRFISHRFIRTDKRNDFVRKTPHFVQKACCLGIFLAEKLHGCESFYSFVPENFMYNDIKPTAYCITLH